MKVIRAKSQSAGQMEVPSLLPNSSWTELVSFIFQDLSYHLPGANEKPKVPVPKHMSVAHSLRM